MDNKEELAKLLYVWVHGATSGNWDKKDFPETVRIAYRKRADEETKLFIPNRRTLVGL